MTIVSTCFTSLFAKVTKTSAVQNILTIISLIRLLNMKLIAFVNANELRTCLLVLLIFCYSVVRSQQKEMLMNALHSKRFDVAPRDVITRSSATRCAATCRDTSWCVSVNLFTGDGTCQLLSEEASNETSLETVDGWRYLCKFGSKNSVRAFGRLRVQSTSTFLAH